MFGHFSWIRGFLQGFSNRADRRANRRPLRKSNVRLNVERLEARVVPSISTWTQTGSGAYSWETAGNWSSLPTAGSSILIPSNDAAGSQTITVDGFAASLVVVSVQATGAVTIAAGNSTSSVLDLKTLNDASGAGGLTISANVIVTAGTIQNDRSTPLTISGAIGGSTVEIDNGAGDTVIFSNSGNTYTATDISVGTLQIGNSSAGSVGSGDVTDDGALIFDATNVVTVAGDIVAAPGTLLQEGAGTVILANNNPVTGATTINSGTALQISNDSSNGTLKSTTITDNGELLFDETGAFSITGAISGSGILLQENAGTVILNGVDTVSGGTTINSGDVIRIGNGGASALAGPITDNGLVYICIGSTTTLSGVISGSGRIQQNGVGTLILDAADTYTGTTTVDSGTTLQIGNDDSTTFTGNGAIADAGVVIFDMTGANTIAGVINNAGSVQQAGGGTVILTGADSYAGATTINSGTTLEVGNGGTTGSISPNNGTVVDNGMLVINLNAAGASTFAGNISGSGALTQMGAGSTTLTGINTYSGGTTITGGILALGADAELGSAPTTPTVGNVVINGGELFADAGGVTLNSNRGIFIGASGGDIDVANGQTLSYAGITGAGLTGSGTLAINNGGNAGALILTGNDGYSGAATVDAGALVDDATLTSAVLQANQAGILAGGLIPSSTAAIAGLTLNSDGTLSVTLGGTIPGTSYSQFTSSGAVNLSGGAGGVLAVNLTTAAPVIGTHYDIIVNQSGSAPGTFLNLPEGSAITATYLGTTYTFAVSYQGLQYTSFGVAGSRVGVTPNDVVLSVIPTVPIYFAEATGWAAENGGTSYALGATIPQAVADPFGNASYDEPSGTIQFGGNAAHPSNSANGTNYYAFSSVDAALKQMQNDGNTGAILVIDGGTFAEDVTTSGTPAQLVFQANNSTFSALTVPDNGTTITLNSNTAGGGGGATTLDVDNTVNPGDMTTDVVAVPITGSGNIQTGGAADLVLYGNNNNFSYTGGTTIGSTSTLQIGQGSTTTWTGGGAVTDQGQLIFNTGAVNTISAAINGSGSIAQLGSGTVILTASSSVTGSTTIGAGSVLEIGNNTPTALLPSTSFTDNGTLIFNSTTGGAMAAPITGSGGVTQSGAGIVTLTGPNTYAGATSVAAGATLQVGLDDSTTFAATGTITDNGTLAFNLSSALTFSGAVSGTGVFAQIGSGGVTLSGTAETFTGALLVGAGSTLAIGNNTATSLTTAFASTDNGTLIIGSGATLTIGQNNPTVFSGVGGVTDNGTLIFNSSNVETIASVISGSGSVTQAGSGKVILDATDTYTGVTAISSSTIQFGNNDSAVTSIPTGFISDNSALTFNMTTVQTITNTIVGSGVLQQEGTGLVILDGSGFDYTGNTLINGANETLQIGNNDATTFTSGTGVLNDNGTLIFAIGAGDTLNFAEVIQHAGSVIEVGAGTVIFSDVCIYTGSTTINSGATLQLGAGGTGNEEKSTAFTDNGALEIDPGNTLEIGNGNNTITFTGNGNITDNGELLFEFGAATDTVTVSDIISGTGALNIAMKNGGTVILAGSDVPLDGAITLQNATGETMQIGNGTATTFSGASTVTNNAGGTLIFDTTAALTFTGAIGGTGSLLQEGSGAVTLAGTNTYTGSTTINSGATLQIAGVGDFGSSATTDNGAFIFNSPGAVTYLGVISSSGTLLQQGAGTAILAGVNTYNGATTISAGTLDLQGSLASPTIAVHTGGTLDGTGSASGTAVSVTGGAIAGGDASNIVGNLTVGSLSFTIGSLNVLADSATSYDKITVANAAGTGVALGNSTTLNLTLGGGYVPTNGDSLDIIPNATSTLTGSFANEVGGYIQDTTDTYSFHVTTGGSGFDVVLVNVEPASTVTSLIDDTGSPTTYGTTVNFTVTVTSGGSPISPSEVVTLEDQNNSDAVLGTGTLSGGSVTIPLVNLPSATYSVFAVYPGDSNYAGSTSTPSISHTVLYNTTAGTPTTTAFNPVTVDTTITITATVSPTNTPNPGGTITFYDNSVQIGTPQPVSTSAGVTTATITDSFPIGAVGTPQDITAQYNGDGTNYAASPVSGALVVNVSNPVTAPTVTSVVVNGDAGDNLAGSNSRVATLYVTFSEAVQLDSNPFTLALHNNVTVNGVAGQQVGTLPGGLAWSSSDNIHWTVTFTGTNNVNVTVGSDGHITILNGVYDLTVNASAVHPQGSPAVDMASSYTQTFWALFGDSGANDSITHGTIGDGTSTVSIGIGDFNGFANSFGSASYNVAQGYNPIFDVNGDGSIDVPDFDAFAGTFGTTWKF